MTNPIQDQPDPQPNDRPAVWDLVIADMQARDQLGRERYGTRLQPHNGRDAMRDLYDEILDAAVYCRQVMEERKEHEQTRGDNVERVPMFWFREEQLSKQAAIKERDRLADKLAEVTAERDRLKARFASVEKLMRWLRDQDWSDLEPAE